MLFEAELCERIKFIGNYRSILKFFESIRVDDINVREPSWQIQVGNSHFLQAFSRYNSDILIPAEDIRNIMILVLIKELKLT